MIKKKYLIWFPVLLVLYELPTYLSNDAYLPALPAIVRDFSTKTHLVQLTLTFWFLGSSFMQLVLGPISDRYGRRIVLLSGGLLFIASTIGCALASTLSFLLWMRFFQGVTVTSMIVSGYGTVHDLFDHEKAIHTLAWMYSISVLAPSVGPLFGALILYFGGWREIFWVLVVWGILVMMGLYLYMPETAKKESASIHPMKIIRGYYRMLCRYAYMRLTLSFCLLFGAMIAWLTAGSFLVMNEFHQTAFLFGVYQCVIFACYILGTRALRCLLKKRDMQKLIRIGLSVALLGSSFSLVFAWLIPTALIILVICVSIIALSMGFCSPMLNRAAVEAAMDAPMGSRIALYSFLTSLFGMLASMIMSGFYNGHILSLSVILFIMTAAAFILNLIQPRTEQSG
jgi:Bcr/CflA subfamily drug resistance transporter